MNKAFSSLSFSRIMDGLSQGVQSLIGPPSLLCSSCGKAGRYPRFNPLGVCQNCFDAIPWITRVVCPVCGRAGECPDCLRQEIRYLAMNRSAVQYDDGMRELLARYKYRGDERLSGLLGRMLVHPYRLYLKDQAVKRGFDFITYVPVSPGRYAERGFNQAEQMAVVLAQQVNLPAVSVLTRLRDTDKQSMKSRHERFDNMKGAFSLIPGRGAKLHKLAGGRPLRILLVDDVYTTGSTLNQCALEIRRELPGALVYGLCWAR